MEFQVIITPLAEQDLGQIGRYIARNNAAAAYPFCNELVFTTQSLKNFPHRHGNLARRPNIRKLPYRNYLIFYKIHEDAGIVEILRFWHSAQNQNRLRLKEQPAVYAAEASPVS